jgi:glycosyltransferase involved in cell wall biosynthesis
MRIVYTTDSAYPLLNGIATAIDSSIRYLAAQGHEVHLIAPEYPESDTRSYPPGITVHRFASYNLWFTTNKEQRFVSSKEFNRLRQLLSNLKPDLIHNHLEYTVAFVVRTWALKNKVPLVQTIHTYYPPYYKIYVPFLPLAFWKWFIKEGSKRFYKPFNLLITPSNEMKKVITELYGMKQEVAVVPIGIEMDKFSGDNSAMHDNSPLLTQYPRIKNRRRLLFVGRIGSEKNIDFLFKVMQKLLAKRDDVELLVVGTGSYMAHYQNLIKKMHIDSHTTFLGAFPNSEMKNIYALGDIFTFPSITEAQGVVTTEALVNHLPVVAVRALGSIDVLQGERGGFLVAEEVSAFLEKVELLLDNPQVYAKKKAEAAERAKELSFDNTTGPELIKLYTKLLGQ